MKKIVYLPLDERPCNYYFPTFCLGNNEICTVSMPIDYMCHGKKPADYPAVRDFLLSECREADYLVMALDTLLYGGIIPSRLHHLSRCEVAERLSVIREIKSVNPNIRVYAFSLVMRCPCYSDSSEEPDYYAVCGREIALWGQNEHKHALGVISDGEYEREREKLSVCIPYIDDYEERRRVNVETFILAVDMIGKEIDEFLILQDDSSTYGYTAIDRNRVKKAIESKGVDVLMYPGADEGGMTLMSRVATHSKSRTPKIYPVYVNERARTVKPMYEYCELELTVSQQIKSAGALEASSEYDADILLFLNLADDRTYERYLDAGMQSDESYIPGFVEKMSNAQQRGIGVAVADIAYCNGGDVSLVREMDKQLDILALFGYAGWNTSSNALGTVISQAVMRYLYGDSDAHRLFTATRILDDAIYASSVRRTIMDERRLAGLATNNLDARCELTSRIVGMTNEVAMQVCPSVARRYSATDCYLPWGRLFEIMLYVEPVAKN